MIMTTVDDYLSDFIVFDIAVIHTGYSIGRRRSKRRRASGSESDNNVTGGNHSASPSDSDKHIEKSSSKSDNICSIWRRARA